MLVFLKRLPFGTRLLLLLNEVGVLELMLLEVEMGLDIFLESPLFSRNRFVVSFEFLPMGCSDFLIGPSTLSPTWGF